MKRHMCVASKVVFFTVEDDFANFAQDESEVLPAFSLSSFKAKYPTFKSKPDMHMHAQMLRENQKQRSLR